MLRKEIAQNQFVNGPVNDNDSKLVTDSKQLGEIYSEIDTRTPSTLVTLSWCFSR